MRVLFHAIAFVFALTGSALAGDRPNVMFLISDDLTAEALSCYGDREVRTPNIDRLAARGVKFARAYTQYPLCAPSRAALMSGMYPQRIRIHGNYGDDRFTRNLGDRPTLAQHFKNEGYNTTRISKIFHMRIPGDITAGVSGPDHAPSWTRAINTPGPEWQTKGEHSLPTNQEVRRAPDVHYNLGFGGALYIVKAAADAARQPDALAADEAVAFLEKREQGDDPFFLAVGFIRPHVPFVAPAEHFEPYPPRQINPIPIPTADQTDIPAPGISRSSQELGIADKPQNKREILAGYYASVAFMDEQVGRVLDALDASGLTEDTIVVFTSDHGFHLGEHDLWEKMSLHEESVRVPLIIAGPQIEPAETDALAEHVDLYPTLAELAGLPLPEHLQGESLVSVLKDPTADVRDAAYTLRRRNDHLLRTDRWSYVRYADGSEELYDMQEDRNQYTNLAAGVGHSRTLQEMRQALDVKLKSIGK